MFHIWEGQKWKGKKEKKPLDGNNCPFCNKRTIKVQIQIPLTLCKQFLPSQTATGSISRLCPAAAWGEPHGPARFLQVTTSNSYNWDSFGGDSGMDG